MKTAEEIMKQIPHLEACINHMGCFTDFQIAMQVYGEQIIDEAIKNSIYAAYVPKGDLLKIKNELK